MKLKIYILVLPTYFSLANFYPLTSWANYEKYDNIVDKLSENLTQEVRKKPNMTTLNNLRKTFKNSFSLGLTQTFYNFSSNISLSGVHNQGGLSLSLGRNWTPELSTEASYTYFSEVGGSYNLIRLSELTLRGIYQSPNIKNWNIRIGFGLSSRFLNVQGPNPIQVNTPSALVLLGVVSYLGPRVSIGSDITFKTATVDDTIDRNSMDLAFKVNTHF